MLRTPLNDDWTVHKDGDPRPPVPVTLPHDAMISETRDPELSGGQNTGYFPGGRYHYTRTITQPDAETAVLEFEGVFHRSHVLLNGKEIGGRPSGYATFHVDLHPHLHEGENLLEVVADTSDQPNSRWYTGSGIYRPVTLLTGPALHVAPLGLRVLTESASPSAASLEVLVDVANETPTPRDAEITVELTAPDGSPAGARAVCTVPAGETLTTRIPIELQDPQLWSPQEPTLYEARAVVRTLGRDGGVAGPSADGPTGGPTGGRKHEDRQGQQDVATATTGIRHVQVDATHGFRLNGQTVNLRGACIHHDNGVLGAAEFDAAADRRIRILKEAGFNAIRSAHNPTSNAILRACDQQGMLVLDELTDAWYLPKQVGDYGLDFEQWWRRDLEAMVLRDGSHPSVVMYSIGNEIAETSQPHGIALSRDMTARIRELDRTRPVTNGINLILNALAPDDATRAKQVATAREHGEDQNKNLIVLLNYAMGLMEKVMPRIGGSKRADARSRDAFAPLDVAGYNYAHYRYRKDGALHPDRVILGTETNPPDIASNWAMVEQLPYLIGDFQWTGWDYLGEAGVAVIRYDSPRAMFLPYPTTLAGEPVIDITGHAQPQTFLNRIAFGLDRGPVLAVQPVDHAGEKQSSTPWRSSNAIRSWAWEGCEGTAAVVEVYAHAPRVDVVLNGRLLGTRAIGLDDGYAARIEVPYEPGELTAVAYDESGAEIGRDVLRSAGEQTRLTVVPDHEELRADGSDLAHLSISLTDEEGVVRPLADRPVRVQVDGVAVLAGSGSANPITQDRYDTGDFTTFHGRGLAVVRSTRESGEVTVTVRADGVEPVSVQLWSR
jgi:beta-galactosidase